MWVEYDWVTRSEQRDRQVMESIIYLILGPVCLSVHMCPVRVTDICRGVNPGLVFNTHTTARAHTEVKGPQAASGGSSFSSALCSNIFSLLFFWHFSFLHISLSELVENCLKTTHMLVSFKEINTEHFCRELNIYFPLFTACICLLVSQE